MNKYPICDFCNIAMTEFDGCWWYTCPKCGNRIKHNDDGSYTSYAEIFTAGSKEFSSDFELANFCHGDDLI